MEIQMTRRWIRFYKHMSKLPTENMPSSFLRHQYDYREIVLHQWEGRRRREGSGRNESVGAWAEASRL